MMMIIVIIIIIIIIFIIIIISKRKKGRGKLQGETASGWKWRTFLSPYP